MRKSRNKVVDQKEVDLEVEGREVGERESDLCREGWVLSKGLGRTEESRGRTEEERKWV